MPGVVFPSLLRLPQWIYQPCHILTAKHENRSSLTLETQRMVGLSFCVKTAKHENHSSYVIIGAYREI